MSRAAHLPNEVLFVVRRAGRAGASIHEIADAVSTGKATTRRVLASLEAVGLIQRTGRRYLGAVPRFEGDVPQLREARIWAKEHADV